MSLYEEIGWGILAVSIFNAILLLWLGMTVLLNADERRPGIWLTSGSLILGAGFFLLHFFALLAMGPGDLGDVLSRTAWTIPGWIAALVIPLAWYLITLWHAGFWDNEDRSLRLRHRGPLAVALLLIAAVAVLLAIMGPALVPLGPGNSSDNGRLLDPDRPLIPIVYSTTVLLCVLLSIDALRHPIPSARIMGDVARRRARPWLIAASSTLIAVCLAVGALLTWLALGLEEPAVLTPNMIDPETRLPIELRFPYMSGSTSLLLYFDLGISILIALATVLAGQGLASYEIFTGRVLPRQGLARQWRRVMMLAAGYSAVIGWTFTLAVPNLAIIFATILLALVLAYLSWRSYAEQERFMRRLRPFVSSQRLYEHVVNASPSSMTDADVMTPFRALCAEVLRTEAAYLVPLGSTAPENFRALSYPDGAALRMPWLPEVIENLRSPSTLYTSLDPARYDGLAWAISLWGERGMTGLLLLGEKWDGSLYAHEEMEIARASGERLVDTLASVEIARRLVALQRHHLTQMQVLDQRTRQVLHDEILPRIHAAMLTLRAHAAGDTASDPVAVMTETHRRISDLLREMPAATASSLISRAGLAAALRKTLHDELGNAFESITWTVEPGVEERLAVLPQLVSDVVYYAAREAFRNAARHGRGGNDTRPLRLDVRFAVSDGIEITIEDNGVGFSRNDRSGDETGGHGLSLHSTMMAVVGGSLTIESVVGKSTRVTLRVGSRVE